MFVQRSISRRHNDDELARLCNAPVLDGLAVVPGRHDECTGHLPLQVLLADQEAHHSGASLVLRLRHGQENHRARGR